MTVLVDSWAWIEYYKGSTAGQSAKAILESEEEVIVSAMNVAEVMLFLLRNQPAQCDVFMQGLFHRSFVIPLNTEIAIEAAKIKMGRKMGMADAIVYATAKHQKARLLTGDDDFKGMQGVEYIGA